jgi:glycosyltransferase involved in cell wall biosynthesis
MSAPTVSVLLTTYNREAFLAAAIESVLGQTFTDFELLVVDDGSSDRSVEIAHSYEHLDSRVRVVVNDCNLGQFRNRNHAAGLARGSLLKYQDSDDLMYPHCLAVMVSMLQAEPRAGFGLSSGSRWSGGPCPMLLTPRMAYQREFFGEGLFFCGPSGALFRSEVFRALGGFPDEGVASDHLFWMRACKTVNVLLMPADLFWYRLHPAQEFQSAKGQQEYARVPGLVWRELQASDCPLTPEEREQAKRNRAYHVARRTMEDLRRGRFAFALNRLRYSSMRPGDWLRYLRRPRRDAFAGTPLDADGEFRIPAWARPRGGTAGPA